MQPILDEALVLTAVPRCCPLSLRQSGHPDGGAAPQCWAPSHLHLYAPALGPRASTHRTQRNTLQPSLLCDVTTKSCDTGIRRSYVIEPGLSCHVMSHCDVTAGELAGISVLLWSLSLTRWLVPSSSSRSHPGQAGSCCAVRLSLPVQLRRTRQLKCPFAILAARPVACFCLGQSLPLPALLSGDFTSSDAQTSQDSRD